MAKSTPSKSLPRRRKKARQPKTPPVPETPVLRTLPDLLREDSKDQPTIITNLLRQGDQMVLSAAPKTGKSYLAQYIALSLAMPFAKDPYRRFLFASAEHQTTPFEILRPVDPKPAKEDSEDEGKIAEANATKANGRGDRGWKVLFVSLEMPPSEITRRLRQQLPYWEIATGPLATGVKEVPPAWDMGLKFFFGFEKPNGENGYIGRQNLDILLPNYVKEEGPTREGDDAKRLTEIIQGSEAEVIVYDTLIQLHSLNENDNVLMKAVLQKLRSLSYRNGKPVAHIVIHHTRKENPAYRGPLSPEMMRGAGSVHGAADVAMLARLSEDTAKRGIIDVHVSSRSSDVPDFKLEKTKHMTFAWKVLTPDEALKKNQQKARAYQETILAQVRSGDGDPVTLDFGRLIDGVKAMRAEKGWTFAVPEKPSPVAAHVTHLIRLRKIEWAHSFPPGTKGDWEIYPLRLKSDASKPLWREEKSVAVNGDAGEGPNKKI